MKKPLYTLLTPVRITDLNYGNHVGLPNIASIFHNARALLFNAHGFTEANIQNSIGIVLTNCRYQFKSEIFFNTTLIINIYAGNVSKCGFELTYEALDEASQSLMVTATENYAFFHYVDKKIAKIPPAFSTLLS